MFKCCRYLWYRPFTWITDCSGLKKFFGLDLDPSVQIQYLPTHQMQRWKMDMLRFDFTCVHRPEKMLYECNMLSQYNTWTDDWRKQAPGDPTPDPGVQNKGTKRPPAPSFPDPPAKRRRSKQPKGTAKPKGTSMLAVLY